VIDVYSVSNCVSKDFGDYIKYWKHNGYWFFDSPDTIRQVSSAESIDLPGISLFYYEVHELEYDEAGAQWIPFRPEPSFITHVIEPRRKILEGYDVVTFSVKTSAECSPLSCNSLATEVETNQHCLLASLQVAQHLLEQGKFKNTEPGPYRIIAVYTVEWT
jgi:hypothetical protein